MTQFENEPTQVQSFYAGSTIFLTGASGFLGKMMLEKLLRSCPDIKKIYILLRTKKDKEPAKRFEELFGSVVFENVNKSDPNIKNKVEILTGDCGQPNLGLLPESQEKIIKECNIIVHWAATVKFDEHLRIACNINVKAVRDLIVMAKQMPQLKSFLYVSTAFSNCARDTIGECFYEPPLEAEKLIKIVDALDDKLITNISPQIFGEWPNSYVFTKTVAENMVKNAARGLPIGILRPSIVLSSFNEPVPGWIDNLYGATGVLVGAGMGLIRVLHCKSTNIADMVPADYVVNSAIVAVKDVESRFKENSSLDVPNIPAEEAIPIYNYVSSVQNPIDWVTYMTLAYKYCMQIPSPLVLWHYMLILTNSQLTVKLGMIFLHYVPAYVIDFFALCLGKKPLLVKGYQKIHKFSDVIAYFATRQWTFSNDNVQKLWKDLSERDQSLFQFDMSSMEWESYFPNYTRGCRLYLLKDPMETVPQGIRKLFWLKIAHYALCSVLLFAFYQIFRVVFVC